MIPHPHTPWNETAAGTNDGATATKAAVVEKQFFITSISGHIDEDVVVTIESPAGTVLWETKIDFSVEGTQIKSPAGLNVQGVPDAAILGKIANSAADCQININGYSIP